MSWMSDAFPMTPHTGTDLTFPDPFCDYSSTAMPRTWRDALQWCQFIVMRNPELRQAIKRIVAFFMTEIDIGGDVGDVEKQQYKDYLNDHANIMSVLSSGGADYITYGNSVSSAVFPFKRSVACRNPNCRHEAPLSVVMKLKEYAYKWSLPDVSATCPYCKYSGVWDMHDRKGSSADDLNVKRWPPVEIDLMHCPISDARGHIWRIPGYYKDQIRRGDAHQLVRCPKLVLQAIANNNNIEFDPAYVHHFAEPTLCGVENRGWGFPSMLTLVPQAWYVQVLRRTNEAIGLDFVFPFRLITPAPRNTSGASMGEAPIFGADMQHFNAQVRGMLGRRRMDPTAWHSLPYPVQYQALGGEASQMVSDKLLEQGIDHLLNALGLPAEYYRASLTLQTAMPAMRVIQSTWIHMWTGMVRQLNWLVRKISAEYSWDEVTATLIKPSHADDMNIQLAKLQLMAQDAISQRSGLQGVGMDFEEETDRKLSEQRYMAKRTAEVQEDMELMGLGPMLAQGGGMPGEEQMPPGGGQMPPGGGGQMAGGQPGQTPYQDPVEAIMAMLPQPGDQSTTPAEMEMIATQIAQMLEMLPSHTQQSTLRKLKNMHPPIHAMVRQKREQIRSEHASQGIAAGEMAAQEAGQQQVTMAPTGPQM